MWFIFVKSKKYIRVLHTFFLFEDNKKNFNFLRFGKGMESVNVSCCVIGFIDLFFHLHSFRIGLNRIHKQEN